MMRKISIVLFLFLLVSCSLTERRNVTVSIPQHIKLESLTYETPWYTMSVFDGERIVKKHITQGVSKAEINIVRAALSLVLLEPEGGYAPLGAFIEPGMTDGEIVFTHDRGAFISSLMKTASVRPSIVSRLSMSMLEKTFPVLSAIDIEAFREALSEGTLGKDSAIGIKKLPVTIEGLPSGIWRSDREDINDIVIRRTGAPTEYYFYPGRYRFICIERKLVMNLRIGADGSQDSFLKPVIYINKAFFSDV